ncbi:hypothetical protein CEXT_444411, partial [Caerostris extrusa]
MPDTNIMVTERVANRIHCAARCSMKSACKGFGFDPEKTCFLLDVYVDKDFCDAQECSKKDEPDTATEAPTTEKPTTTTEAPTGKPTTATEAPTTEKPTTTTENLQQQLKNLQQQLKHQQLKNLQQQLRNLQQLRNPLQLRNLQLRNQQPQLRNSTTMKPTTTTEDQQQQKQLKNLQPQLRNLQLLKNQQQLQRKNLQLFQYLQKMLKSSATQIHLLRSSWDLQATIYTACFCCCNDAQNISRGQTNGTTTTFQRNLDFIYSNMMATIWYYLSDRLNDSSITLQPFITRDTYFFDGKPMKQIVCALYSLSENPFSSETTQHSFPGKSEGKCPKDYGAIEQRMPCSASISLLSNVQHFHLLFDAGMAEMRRDSEFSRLRR